MGVLVASCERGREREFHFQIYFAEMFAQVDRSSTWFDTLWREYSCFVFALCVNYDPARTLHASFV